tara:strand:+ start:366 stop:1073 length:708 start_codon:yes stop_codon:yes gene_type:complete
MITRKEINEEAASHWDLLVETAQLVAMPRNKMNDRSYKSSSQMMKGKNHVTKKEAEIYASDLMHTFLEYSDDRVRDIISKGGGSAKHYLVKYIMFDVVSPKSSVNYKTKVLKGSESLDKILEDEDHETISADITEEDRARIFDITKYDSTNNDLMDIVDEAIETLTVQERALYLEVKVRGSHATQLTKKDMDYLVEYVSSYQTNLRIINHAHKKVLIYMQIPSVAKRIKTILNNE